MSRRPYMGISEAQAAANADAIRWRDAPYSTEHSISASVANDYRRREPRDVREAVHAVRRAYADEVPTKIHEGPDSIGEGGTPKMTARAEGYMFGRPDGDDAGRNVETNQRDGLGFYHAPFRAALSSMARSPRESHRHHAAIVTNVVFGQMEGAEAAIAEGVPSWCAGFVALLALRSFISNMSNVVVHPSNTPLAESVTAA